MSNREVFDLQEMYVEEHQVREVLKCIAHSIIFNRALGHVSPSDRDLELINVTYPTVSCETVDSQIEAGLTDVEVFLNQYRSKAKGVSAAGFPFNVRLSFYESVSRPGFVGTYEEKVYWETWKIRMKLVQSKQSVAERTQRQADLESELNGVRTVIVMYADGKKDHIPPASERYGTRAQSPLTFPFELQPEIASSSGLKSIMSGVSRMLSSTSHAHPDVLG